MSIYGRTDLASEARVLRLTEDASGREPPGVRAEQLRLHGLPVTAVEILDERGEAALGKPRGLYYTLELPGRLERGGEVFPRAARALAELLNRCLRLAAEESVLVAALGNPDITPDAVGPLCAGSVLVTRHLKQSDPEAFRGFRPTALCRTGVLGTTGVESAVQLRALCESLRPARVLAVDALAGTELGGLCRRIQVCDSGIAPGSGVGNDRQALSRETLGVPVTAVGVPTVIDASSLSGEEGLASFFATPRDIDSAVRAAARLIGYGIDLALHPGLRLEDIDLLTG